MTKRRLGASYHKLFISTVISNVGDGMSIIAYPWLASAITRNPILISLVVLVQRLPWLVFTLPAGVITDRVDRKRAMVIADFARFALTLVVALAVLAKQSGLPGPNDLAGVHGTQTGLYIVLLCATLLLGTGEVLHQTRKRHTAADVLAFFKEIDASVPRRLDVHVVLDNLSAHNAPVVREWLEHPRRARWHLHFTPTSSSWLNLVEGWFAQLTNKRLRSGSFDSISSLVDAIDLWTARWNDDPKPFVWHRTAKQIITKVKRGRVALNHQIKSATDH